MVFNRLAVVLAATVTGLMSVVTLSAAPAGGATAARGIRHPLWVATFHGPPGGNSQAVAEAVSPDGARLFVTGSLGASAISQA